MATAAIRKVDGGDELRRAVSDAQRVKLAIDEARPSIERAEQQIRDAEQRLVAATAVIEKERKHLADQMADAAAAGRQAPATGAMRAARLAAADAEDSLAAAKDALRSLRTGLSDLEIDAATADRVVDRVLAETLRPVALQLLQEVHDLTAHRFRKQAALSVLGKLLDGSDTLARAINRTAGINDDYARVAIATEQEWRAAVELLKKDPSAKLPGFAGD